MKLVHAPPTRCRRTLQKGMAIRMMARGPLHGYTIACPGCGFTTLHMTSEGVFTESAEWTKRPGPLADGKMVDVAQPATVSMSGLSCIACRRGIVVVENEIDVVTISR